MTTFWLIWVGATSVLIVVPRLLRGRMSTAQLATFVQWARGVDSEGCTIRVATEQERTEAPSVNVDGMRELGALATSFRAHVAVNRYVIDETRTIVAMRRGAALIISSTAGNVQYTTYCLKVGLPCAPPDVEREWFPLHASDAKMLGAHRARIAKAAAPLVRIATIEQLADLYAEQSRRTVAWRAKHDQDELFEADLRSILRDRYPARATAVKAKLGSLVPPARVVS